ncbi:MAG: hypothetical protein ABWY30_03185, partial [Microterricola sp.]
GRFVAYSSDASNLVPGDTNGAADVFVVDRQTNITTRVSVASDGTEASGSSSSASISADGRFVTYWSDASNLVPGDTNGVSDVFVVQIDVGPPVDGVVTLPRGRGAGCSTGCHAAAREPPAQPGPRRAHPGQGP